MIRRALTSVAAVLLIGAPTAQAQTINFVGSTQFCFTAVTATSCSSYSNSATLGGLTLASGSFNVTTFGGFAAITNLGLATLTTAAFDYSNAVNRRLWMRVTFTSPPGSSTPTFESYLAGAVSGSGAGGVQVAFTPASVSGTFAGGLYTLNTNTLNLAPGTSSNVTGSITASVVPEPSTYVLMGTGMLALLGVARRRRRSGSATTNGVGDTPA
ncbi:MAG: PEP-CTERM sorting domain-containing protein [Gemmatimonadetes bacterium]|nr:PEP-CTERM sorting domain-containing protein [Gemmatimonadota bacterium]